MNILKLAEFCWVCEYLMMVIEQQQIAAIENAYTLETVPCAVPQETAETLGRLLFENGYKMELGVVYTSENDTTISRGLAMHDSGYRYDRSSEEKVLEEGIVYGPYFSVQDGEEYCPMGFAVWRHR